MLKLKYKGKLGCLEVLYRKGLGNRRAILKRIERIKLNGEKSKISNTSKIKQVETQMREVRKVFLS